MKTSAVLELIKVSYVGPHGPKVGDTWYRLGKGVKVTSFAKDHTYSVLVWTADNGAKYINKIEEDITPLSDVPASVPVLNPAINQAPTVAPVADTRPRRAGFDKPLTEYDLDKDLQIAYSGLLQSAMGAVASHVSTVDKLITESQRVAQEQLVWIKKQVSSR